MHRSQVSGQRLRVSRLPSFTWSAVLLIPVHFEFLWRLHCKSRLAYYRASCSIQPAVSLFFPRVKRELKTMVIVSILETSPHPKANSWLPVRSHFFNVHLNAPYSEDVKGFRSQVSGNKNKIQVQISQCHRTLLNPPPPPYYHRFSFLSPRNPSS